MKVSHINFSDFSGGASIAANRICKSLRTHGLEIELRVQKKYSSLDYVQILNSRYHDFYTSIIRKLEFLLSKFLLSSKESFSISMHFSNAHKKINDLPSDLIHLHWINGGMLSIKDISRIQKPLVWTLHDMWAFSGPRHYYLDPDLRAISGINTKVSFFERLLAKIIFNKKTSFWRHPIYIVAPSQWMADQAKNSSLMKNWPISVIKNPIDTVQWTPENQSLSREFFKLPQKSSLILFGAAGGIEDQRKGFSYLKNALKNIEQNDGIELVIYGGTKSDLSLGLNIKVHNMGYISDPHKLKKLYSACNVLVIPSIQDNLPNTAIESLACSTPVVAFNLCGMPDIILHKKTGYLAEAYNSDDLMNGINWTLNPDISEKVKKHCRDHAIENFALEVVGKEYINLYEKILKESQFHKGKAY